MTGSEPDAPADSGTDPRQPVLVIGGTGHVGAALCCFLLRRGHQVTAASRTGQPVFESPAINRIRLDVTDTADNGPLPPLTTAVICPWVEKSSKIDSHWMEHLLQRIATAGYRSVIYFSTMWVYGARPQGLLTESTPVSPASPYGISHLQNETLLRECAEDFDLDVAILRMANLVGADPFFRFRSKVAFAHELVTMAIEDGLIVLRSPPSTPRDLIPRMLLHHDLEPLLDRVAVEGRVDILNLGSGSTTTMLDLARQIADLAKRYAGEPVRVEYPEESVVQPMFHLDTARIRSLAGPCASSLSNELEFVLEDVVRLHSPVDQPSEP